MAGKKKKKQSKKKQTESSGGTTVNVNVAMTMTNSTDKVKRIRSRRRPNIREMRRRMGPGFFGNVAQLSNNALNTLQNERYALETDIRGLKAQRDVLAGAAAGGVGAGAGAAGAGGVFFSTGTSSGFATASTCSKTWGGACSASRREAGHHLLGVS